jgi:hypothetical protein
MLSGLWGLVAQSVTGLPLKHLSWLPAGALEPY